MKCKYISLMGVDGSGKTTLLRALEDSFASSNVEFLRIPQTFFNIRTEYRPECEAFEELSKFADSSRDLSLKTVSLFLPMCFSGWIQRNLVLQSKCRALIYERQPVIDSLVYADFYTPYIKSALIESQLISARQALGHHWQAIENGLAQFRIFLRDALKKFPEKLPSWREDFSIENFPLLIRDIFQLPVETKTRFLFSLFGFDSIEPKLIPNFIFLLELDRSILEQRIVEKVKLGREMHEQVDTLLKLQHQLRVRASEFCSSEFARLDDGSQPQLIVLPIKGLSKEMLVDRIIHSSELASELP